MLMRRSSSDATKRNWSSLAARFDRRPRKTRKADMARSNNVNKAYTFPLQLAAKGCGFFPLCCVFRPKAGKDLAKAGQRSEAAQRLRLCAASRAHLPPPQGEAKWPHKKNWDR